MAQTIRLQRFCYAPVGTFGRLNLPSGWGCYTVERPWVGNEPNRSCIPEGVYDLGLRRSSPVVERTTGGEFREGWEVRDVTGRTYIMLHPGNTLRDTEGCICPGRHLGYITDVWAVTDSRVTFRRLMRELGQRGSWTLDIRLYRPEYP